MPTASNLSETVKSKFLQLSGGTVTGAVAINRADGHIYKKDASGRLLLRGGTSTATDGASIYLTGKDYSSGASTFQVRCHDGTNDKSFIAKPDGTLTWGGNSVVCISSYQKGTNWYRKYSDGFIEQGGRVTETATNLADKLYTFSLTTAFTTTTYYCQAVFVQTKSTGNWGAGGPAIVTKNTATAVVCPDGINTSHPITGFDWYACGY